jgi:hypothetical protein
MIRKWKRNGREEKIKANTHSRRASERKENNKSAEGEKLKIMKINFNGGAQRRVTGKIIQFFSSLPSS